MENLEFGNDMMADRMAVLIFLFVSLFPPAVASESTLDDMGHQNSYVVVLAKPSRVRFYSEIAPARSDDFVIGSLFSARLNIVEVMHGALDEKRVDVVLAASHREVLSSGRLIAALLRISGQDVDVLYWGDPFVVACLPTQLVKEADLANRFFMREESPNRAVARSCAPANLEVD